MVLSDSALVLVAILPSQRDYEIARVLGWYRIPLRTAPKVIDVDYLAFYQTSAFGNEDRWQIQYAAEVHGHELVQRLDLFHDEPDHPRAHEEYYKISIGPLLRLDKPIQADRWKRLTFFYTTGNYLNQATSLKDLMVGSEERQFLWQALRERALQANAYHTKDEPELEIDPSLFGFLGDFLGKADEDGLEALLG